MPGEPESNVPLWMFLTLLGAVGSLLGLLGTVVAFALRSIIAALRDHAKEDMKRAEDLAVAKNDIKRIEAEIGDRKSGIRGWLHELANDISPYIVKRQREDRDK